MDEEERESAALHVRERIYVTFATLAVALTLSSLAEDLGAGAAAASITITAIGTVVGGHGADHRHRAAGGDAGAGSACAAPRCDPCTSCC